MAKRGKGRAVVKAGTSKAAAAQRKALFVEGMLIHNGNQTQAAIHAGYPARSAHVTGSRLLKDAKVSAALEVRRAEQLAASKLTSDETLQSIARDVRFDPANVVDNDGKLIPLKQMDKDTRLALRGVEVFQEFQGKGKDKEYIGDTVKLKFPEKTAAREQAMKHFGLYEAHNRQQPPLTVNVGVLTVKPSEDHFKKIRERALAA